jgi:hypothetical protein
MTVLIGKMAGELATTSRAVDRIRTSMKGTEGRSDRLNGSPGSGWAGNGKRHSAAYDGPDPARSETGQAAAS